MGAKTQKINMHFSNLAAPAAAFLPLLFTVLTHAAPQDANGSPPPNHGVFPGGNATAAVAVSATSPLATSLASATPIETYAASVNLVSSNPVDGGIQYGFEDEVAPNQHPVCLVKSQASNSIETPCNTGAWTVIMNPDHTASINH